MTVQLAFNDGSISGSGGDRIGQFVIKGQYSLEPRHMRFEKMYEAHVVRYVGAWDGQEIWGIWSIGYSDVGEFRLWRSDAVSTASVSRKNGD